MPDQLLTTEQAASYLGVSPAFLERDRWAGESIPYIRIGSRLVRYRQSDLDDYVDERRANDYGFDEDDDYEVDDD